MEPAEESSPLPPPIIRKATDRQLSPVKVAPLPSPRFQSPSSSSSSVTASPAPAQQPSYFGAVPSTPSILLKSSSIPDAVPVLDQSPAATSQSASVGLGLVDLVQGSHGASQATLGPARVASPDGGASEASAATSSASDGGWSNSTAPSSTVGSPEVKPVPNTTAAASRPLSPTESLATLSLGNTEPPTPVPDANAQVVPGAVRVSRSPSPHCHFAPLPKVDGDRPGTRRNSVAQGQGAVRKMSSGSDTPDEPFALELDEGNLPPNALASTLLNIAARPQTRSRGSSFSRSASPSPTRRPGSAQSSSRSHSPPPMSRHGSQDALHLHYIQGSRSANRSTSRDRSGEREREREFDSNAVGRGRDPHALRDDFSTGGSSGRASPFEGTGEQPARDGASPVPRKTAFVEPTVDRGIGGKCRPFVRSRSRVMEDGVEREVVEVDPAESEESGSELDEVEEVDEDEEEEDVDEEDEDDEEEEEDNEEDADEGNDEEEEEEPSIPSKTTLGAGVEVIHWHKDSPPPAKPAELAPEIAATS
ncbi:hypothetical protein MNV49_003306 [Pseudohyphozyma bogoriensis]|nr:hypothetical protein MNV49_003306 [Pseudohyphozyma bogoriensis]